MLAFAIEEVSRIEQQFVVVDGRGITGACVGDSGGPLLARTDDGSVRVVGVLDDGARGCTGEDFYTRTDVLATWNEFSSRVPSPPVAPIICEGVDGEGICVRGRAFWCEHGNVRVQDCGAGGNVCGWDVATSGFRCMAMGRFESAERQLRHSFRDRDTTGQSLPPFAVRPRKEFLRLGDLPAASESSDGR